MTTKSLDKDSTTTTTIGASGQLLQDVFRRADKNDDGIISIEEFFSYFQDEVISDKDVNEVFKSIDTNKNNRIEVEELIAYFQKDFEPYVDLFTELEKGHQSVSEILQRLFQTYPTLDHIGQFKVRFYLTEYLKQIEMLHKPIKTALKQIKKSTLVSTDKKNGKVVPYHYPLHHSALQHQIDRLSSLVAKFETSKIHFNLQEQVDVDNSEHNVTVVSRTHVVHEDHVREYIDTTTAYLTETKLQKDCLFTYIQKKTEKETYTLFEFWQTGLALIDHYKQPHYKAHAKSLIDFLAIPETIHKMEIPQNWTDNTIQHNNSLYI